MPGLSAVTLAFSAEAGRYLHWGIIDISLTNLSIIIAMLVLFGLALVLPFPRPAAGEGDDERDEP